MALCEMPKNGKKLKIVLLELVKYGKIHIVEGR